MDKHLNISMEEFPTEVLFHIFLNFSPKELGIGSQVCTRWKAIIDSVFESDKYWRAHCLKDFGQLARGAYYKSACGSTWRTIYRSLKLWPKLLQAHDSRDEFAITTHEGDEVYGFQVLRKGVVGVHKQNYIKYYYIKDLRPVDVPELPGHYLKYMENDDTRVFLGLQFNLFIVRKYVMRKDFQHNTMFDKVKLFKLVDRFVYFVKLNDELCVCDLNDSRFSCSVLCTVPIMTFTVCKNNILILTKTCNLYVYELDKKHLNITDALQYASDPLSTLRKYGFLDDIDQHANFSWMNIKLFVFRSNKINRDITCIKTYGDILFVGTKYGIFQIYHLNSDETLSFLNKKPMKEYNFMENNDLSVHIHQIDVVEGDNQHTVLVALENKIISLKFSHF